MEDEKKMELWNEVKQPPEAALKAITGGRLKGMTDVNPQWRYQALTEQFGPCGYGWKYEIVKLWTEPAPEGQIFAFAQVNLYIAKNPAGNPWGDPIPGIGGSMLVTKEKLGLHASDEGYKMAVTDALSVACKMLGVAADIYLGLGSDSKYDKPANRPASDKPPETDPLAKRKRFIWVLVNKAFPGKSKEEIKLKLEDLCVAYVGKTLKELDGQDLSNIITRLQGEIELMGEVKL